MGEVGDSDFQSFVREFIVMFEGCVGIGQSVKEEDFKVLCFSFCVMMKWGVELF